jgi:23S rRNA (uracil1939-C5)-methyltransferase
VTDNPEAPVLIERIGARGDGVAETSAGRVFVPYALPGETWTRQAGESWQRIGAASPDRAAAPCPHFGTCGGCVAQHMNAETYRAWKQQIAVDAFAHQGLEIQTPTLWQAPEASRRRVTFAAGRIGGRIRLGYRESGSHALCAIGTCLIADRRITDRLDDLAALVEIIAGAGAKLYDMRIGVVAAANGLAVVVDADGRRLGPGERAALAKGAEAAGILRLTVGRDEIVQLDQPVIDIGGAKVPVPDAAFLQAVPAAEAFMASRVVDAVARAKRVADLFAGLGTLTLPLAARAHVSAFDSDAEALAALEHATRHATGLKPVEVRRRDLFREPLSRGELNAFDAVVFDPPRAGASAQAKALARSTVGVVVAVSCNPATLARDARTLIDGGYHLAALDLVDQFLYSPHLEAVAVLKKRK